MTSIGVFLLLFVPTPSWPFPFSPQHRRDLSFQTAHVCSWPSETCEIAFPELSFTVVGMYLSAHVPSPIVPHLLRPQHLNELSSHTAQVCYPPKDTRVTVLPEPTLIEVGVNLCVFVPSPS
jgi:hypothetical protein